MTRKTVAIVGGGAVLGLYLLGVTTVKLVQDASGEARSMPGFLVNVKMGWGILKAKLAAAGKGSTAASSGDGVPAYEVDP